ncbi:vWFA superfamily incomplete domain protein [Mollivirus kamchatka]|nr:vWFA superfamily incomplete domain protein [Mollivirus kamchatka]
MQAQQPSSSLKPVVRFVPIDAGRGIHHAIASFPEASIAAKSKTAVIFILDRSGSMGGTLRSAVLPSCKSFLRVAKPDHADAVFFSHEAEVISNVTPDNWDMKVRYIDSKGGTTMENGVEEAVTLAIERIESLRTGNSLFVHFVFMTDGKNDSGNKGKAFAAAMQIERERIRAATKNKDVSVYTSAVSVSGGYYGPTADTYCAMQVQQALTNTVVGSDLADCFSCASGSDISRVVENLSRDHERMTKTDMVELKMTLNNSSDADNGVGFVANPGGAPSTTYRAAASHSQVSCIFVGGDPKKHVKSIEGCDLVFESTPADEIQSAGLLLDLAPDLIKSLRVSQVSAVKGVDISKGIDLVEAIINKVDASDQALDSDHMLPRIFASAKTPQARLKLMRRADNDLRHQLSVVKNARNMSNATPADMERHIIGVDQMKHAKGIMYRAHLDDSTPEERARAIVDSVRKLTKTWPKLDVDHDLPITYISQLTARELWNQIGDEIDDIAKDNPSEADLLYSLGMLGHGINVAEVPSSAVEPWNARIKSVVLDGRRVATFDSLCALDYKRADGEQREIANVLVTIDPADPEPYRRYLDTTLSSAYLGMVFARNPSVVISGQHTALLGMSLCALARQIASGEAITQIVAKLVVEIAHTLSYRIHPSLYWMGVAAKLAAEDPRAYLTTRQEDEIKNQVVPLVALLVFGHATWTRLTSQGKTKALRAILEQSIADTCNKSSEWSETDALFKLAKHFGIERSSAPFPLADDLAEPEDTVFSCDYDHRSIEEHCVAKFPAWSKNILQLWALVDAVHEFVEERLIANDGDIDRPLYALLGADSVSESSLLALQAKIKEKMSPFTSQAEFDPCAVLVALGLADNEPAAMTYVAAATVQALRNPSTAQRRPHVDNYNASPLEDISTEAAAWAYLADTAVEIRKRMYYVDLSAKTARLRAKAEEEARILKEQELARIEDEWHAKHPGYPNVFSEQEVEEHNRDHPEDPWTMSHNLRGVYTGLLSDRCCYPTCDKYLKRTDDLWTHLRPGRCLPGFHGACREASLIEDPEARKRTVLETLGDDRIAADRQGKRTEHYKPLDLGVDIVVADFKSKNM